MIPMLKPEIKVEKKWVIKYYYDVVRDIKWYWYYEPFILATSSDMYLFLNFCFT